jgi:hypothetical protein
MHMGWTNKKGQPKNKKQIMHIFKPNLLVYLAR